MAEAKRRGNYEQRKALAVAAADRAAREWTLREHERREARHAAKARAEAVGVHAPFIAEKRTLTPHLVSVTLAGLFAATR